MVPVPALTTAVPLLGEVTLLKNALPAPKLSLVNGEITIGVSSLVITLSMAVSFTGVILITTESVSLKFGPPLLPLSSVRMVIFPPKAAPATVALLFKLAVGLKTKPFSAALMSAIVPVMRMVSSSVPSLTAVEFVVVLKVKPVVWLSVSVPFSAQMVTVIMPVPASTSLI